MEKVNFENITAQLTEIAVEYGPKLLGAVAVLLIGSWIIRLLTKTFVRVLDRGKTDESLKPFLRSLIFLEGILVLTYFPPGVARLGFDLEAFDFV